MLHIEKHLYSNRQLNFDSKLSEYWEKDTAKVATMWADKTYQMTSFWS